MLVIYHGYTTQQFKKTHNDADKFLGDDNQWKKPIPQLHTIWFPLYTFVEMTTF